MNLEQQVSNKELSQRLKELGVKQESLYEFVTFDNTSCVDHENGGYKTMRFTTIETPDVIEGYIENEFPIVIERCSAFTIAELGEMLPVVLCEYYELNIRHKYYQQKSWTIQYTNDEDSVFNENDVEAWFEADTEADARAKMMIYLLENKLINL